MEWENVSIMIVEAEVVTNLLIPIIIVVAYGQPSQTNDKKIEYNFLRDIRAPPSHLF
jgi:hypothetical protein